MAAFSQPIYVPLVLQSREGSNFGIRISFVPAQRDHSSCTSVRAAGHIEVNLISPGSEFVPM